MNPFGTEFFDGPRVRLRLQKWTENASQTRKMDKGVRLIETKDAVFFEEKGVSWFPPKATKPLQGVFGWLRLTPHPTTPKEIRVSATRINGAKSTTFSLRGNQLQSLESDSLSFLSRRTG